MTTYWIFVSVFCGLLEPSLATDKRIFLNDNDVYQQLQEMQTLKAQFSAFQSEIATLKSTVAAQQTETATLKNTVTTQTQKITYLEQKAGLGAVYTRWGRLGCPTNNTEMIYTGLAGGGWYDFSGSAANHICLPHDPTHSNGLKGTVGNYGRVYGAEYQDGIFGGHLNKDVPCAVCFAKHASSILMTPGKNTCATGWKLEYSGILSTGYYGHKAASEYICIDENPEVLESGFENNDGTLFYPVHAMCGSLKCPPYVNEEVLPCAVCSK